MAMRQAFGVGAVLSRSFRSWIGNFIPFTVLGALVFLPIEFYTWSAFRNPETVDYGDLVDWGNVVYWGGLLAKVVLTGALVYGVFRQLRGKRATIASCVLVGLQRLLPVIGVALLMGLTIFVAALPYGIAVVVFQKSHLLGVLLGIPAAILAASVVCQLWVSIPVAVVERPGVSASLRRSGELTRGNRVSIFGILLLLWVFEVVVQEVLHKVVSGFPLTVAMWSVLGMVVQMAILQAITATVIYHDLRLAKEGVGIEELAAVFD